VQAPLAGKYELTESTSDVDGLGRIGIGRGEEVPVLRFDSSR
jgi:hypothetical protein